MSAHDPLCPQFCDGKPPKCRGGDCTLCDEVDCLCDLIARVRADTDRKWLNSRGKSMVYAAALRDAVEAVTGVYLRMGDGTILRQGGTWENALDRAVAAIEALGGER